jgi:Bardet-Biedl syndrome 4 protein
MASIQVRNSTLRQRQNHYIHSCFIRNDYRNCLQAIEAQLHACNGQSEYPLYIKGLIMRQQGRIEESLTIFQAGA